MNKRGGIPFVMGVFVVGLALMLAASARQKTFRAQKHLEDPVEYPADRNLPEHTYKLGQSSF